MRRRWYAMLDFVQYTWQHFAESRFGSLVGLLCGVLAVLIRVSFKLFAWALATVVVIGFGILLGTLAGVAGAKKKA